MLFYSYQAYIKSAQLTHSHGTATITEKKFPPKIVKKNEFIDCHQESDYTGDRL